MTVEHVKALGRLLLFNLLIAIVITLVLMWLQGTINWEQVRFAFLANLVVSNAIGFICGGLLPRLVPVIWRRPPLQRWSALVFSLVALSYAGVIVSVAALGWIYGWPGSIWPAVRQIGRNAAVITLVIGVSATLYELWRRRIEAANLELKNKEIERERASKLAREAQLASIESRIQPHFLFNALNSISSLIREDPAQAELLVERLSRLLRSSLDTQQASLIPLDEELRIVRDYLDIQATRFAGRLRFTIEPAREYAAMLVPPFSIQTLVENSIKHAIATARAGGAVTVGLRCENGRLEIAVSDDGPGFDASAMMPGHGLDNLQSRLTSLFGPHAALGVRRGSPGCIVTLAVPARQEVPA